MPRSTLRRTLFIVLALLWALGMALAFWWFQTQYIRSFEARSTLFDPQVIRLPAELRGPGPIRLVHFWDPGCPCNIGNQQHLGDLVAEFGPRRIEFHIFRKPGTRGRLPDNLASLQPLDSLEGQRNLPASPAVGIWDQTGQLAYLGPYSEGALCTSSNSFIEPILRALLEHRPVRATHLLAVGCFCDWQP